MATQRRKRTEPLSLIRRTATSNRLLDTVRELARQQQLDQPQVFLSLREAARRFKVRVSEMARVYRRLNDERLLNTIRGSRTMLTGRKTANALHVQGVVALPVSTPRLVKLHDYRECYLQIHDELEARGFIVKRLVFEAAEIDPAEVVARAKDEKVDIVLWLLADDRIREAALRVRDQGVQFVALNIGPHGAVFYRYTVRFRHALRKILESWQADPDVKSVTIVRLPQETPADTARVARIQQFIQEEDFTCRIETVQDWHISTFLKKLCRKRSGAVILADPAASLLATRAPETVFGILRKCRVALLDGPIELPPVEVGDDVRVDLITIDWRRIAGRIADDVASGAAFSETEATVFEAEARLRVPLKKNLRKKL